MSNEARIVSLKNCADRLKISDRYLRTLFHRTDFRPIFRINQIAFYMRTDFEYWATEICTQWR